MVDERRVHWDDVYSTKPADAVSWFQREPAPSLAAIARTGLARDAALLDVGGGASALVDRLLQDGWSNLTVLDISDAALQVARDRLASDAARVAWIAADITQWRPPTQYDLWHDRAVFHFLTEPADRARYLDALGAGLKLGGHLVMATFAPDGPERCSGLRVERYDPQRLSEALGADFERVESWSELHATPWASAQSFNWCRFVKVG